MDYVMRIAEVIFNFMPFLSISIAQMIDKDVELVLTNESSRYDTGIHNAFMAAIPKHDLIQKMMVYVMDQVHQRKYNEHFLSITGPWALLRCFESYFGHSIVQGTDGMLVEEHGGKKYAIQLFTLTLTEGPTGNNITWKGQSLLHTRFPNYVSIMYSGNREDNKPKTPHYFELWNARKVYRDL